jgi:thiol-disulfide isomerase/thioredoxin
VTSLAAFFLAAAVSLTPLNEAAVQKLIASQKGKVLIVNFWATWCGPCREEMPDLIALEKRLGPQGVQLLLISTDEKSDEAKVRQFLETVKAAQPWYIKQADDDDNFINAFDPKWSGALPATFVYDRTGKRVKSFIGEVEMKQLEAVVSGL